MKLTIKTEIDYVSQKIFQSLVDDQARELMHWVCDTREKSIREALIKLGWLPPGSWPDPMGDEGSW